MPDSTAPADNDTAPPRVWWSPSMSQSGRVGLIIEATDEQVSNVDPWPGGSLPADAVRLVPAPAAAVPAETRDARRARNLEAAGIQLADAARTLAYTWETDSTDKRMWDAWKKVGPAIDAWMAALRADDSEGTA